MFFGVVLICFAAAQWSMLSAFRELAPGARRSEVVARGIFAGEKHFTERGWRLRNRAVALQGIAAFFLVVWMGCNASQ
jgi:hypothetical protein